MVPSDAAQPPRNEYVEDGATLVHAINFTFDAATEISVRRILVDGTEILLANPTHYSVAGGLGATGSITKTGVGVAGATIRIDRNTARTQLTDYAAGDDFPAESHEAALDKLTRIVQELARDFLGTADVRQIIAALLTAGNGIAISLNPAGDALEISSTVDDEKIADVIAATLSAGNGIGLAYDDALGKLVITNSNQENLPDCVKLSGDMQSNDGGGGAGAGPLTGEAIQDLVAALLTGGAGINLVYDDVAGTLQIINTSLAGYTDENARDAIGAALVAGARISIAVNDAGDTITISSDALDPTYAGLAVIAEGGAFNFADTMNGRSILYTGGAAAATLRNNAAHALPDGWGNVLRNKGTGTLTIALGAGVSVMVNGAIVAATTISIAVGGVASINRWGVDDFTINGNSKVSFT